MLLIKNRNYQCRFNKGSEYSTVSSSHQIYILLMKMVDEFTQTCSDIKTIFKSFRSSAQLQILGYFNYSLLLKIYISILKFPQHHQKVWQILFSASWKIDQLPWCDSHFWRLVSNIFRNNFLMLKLSKCTRWNVLYILKAQALKKIIPGDNSS